MDERQLHLLISELRGLRKPLHCHLEWAAVLSLISLIQLAIRHPRVPAGSATVGRDFCVAAIGQLRQISPELADFMAEGFEDRYDVMR